MIRDEDFRVAIQTVALAKSNRYKFPDKWRTIDGEARYFRPNGYPACLIGAALTQLGFSPEDVTEGRGAHETLGRLGASEAVCHAAQMAQDEQDCGATWHDAYDTFHETYRQEKARA